MAKLLYIESSPRKDRSVSIAVARTFLEAYKAAHPADDVETVDLWKLKLPEFDGDTINAKYKIMHGQAHSPAEAKAWKAVVDIIERFKRADKYLFSLPMWNFGIPYKLKHFFDIITQPGLAFSFAPETGYQGLITGRPAVVIYARGGEYSSNAQAAAMDFQKSYVQMLLGFIGFTQIHAIVAEPTLAAPETVQKARQAAVNAAVKLAQTI